MEYDYSAKPRRMVGPISLCNYCSADDCTNFVWDVKDPNASPMETPDKVGEGERLIADPKKHFDERTIEDYFCVVECEGFRE